MLRSFLVLAAVFLLFKPLVERQAKSASFAELLPKFSVASNFAVSKPVRDFSPAQPDKGTSRKMGRAEEQARQIPNRMPFRKQVTGVTHDVPRLAEFSFEPMPQPSLVFDGISSNDNAAAYGFRIVPPDTNGDVGYNHYVQAVNSLVRIFDKQGNPLTPPFKLSMLFEPLGTPCSTRNDGDPIVLYDSLADRWFISQFCIFFPPFRQMVAVSKTGDPTGEYFIYEFVMPNVKMNDYPKFGIWTNAIYMTTDQFLGSDYAGTGVFAFDKRKLYEGRRDAGYIYFDLASPSTIRLGNLLPADLDGLKVPYTPNGIFVGYTATEYGDEFDAIRLFEFRPDFQNPANSTFSEMPESPLLVAPFDPTSPEGRADISQPLPGEMLDSQSDRLMYRVAYRNFGNYDALVFNQTVRTTPVSSIYRAGVRVYELRRNLSSQKPRFYVYEQATIGDDQSSRWMASAAQDHQGNLAFGYSYVSDEKKPSILYSGRLASEPVGAFRQEGTIVMGTGVQTGFGFRWGDYSQMSVDPIDDCSFWYTNEYYTLESQNESPFGWLTKIGKFRFSECNNAPRAGIYGFVLNAENGQPIESATIEANAYWRSSDASGSYGYLFVLPGSYSITASARGFESKTVTVSLSEGQISRQDFLLEPRALIEIEEVEFVSESCSQNGSAEPGETATISLKLRNAGQKATANLVVSLQPIGGVLSPSEPQSYGIIEPGSVSQPRSFTFTVSPNISCGSEVILSFNLQDGARSLGTISYIQTAGLRRIAFWEDFDRLRSGQIPSGWTSSSSGGQQRWQVSNRRSVSPPSSAFSSCSTQIGINELVTPPFRINSEQAELRFHNWYELESTFLRNRLYDGAVLEIKIGNGRWQDIETAGGVFIQGGYDGVIDSCCQNPLAGRRGWSGRSGINQTAEFVTTKVKLPAILAGQEVRLRWRVGTDLGTAREGQYIDDVIVYDEYVCGCQRSFSRAPFDFDGDGKTDASVFRPSDSDLDPDFFVLKSSDNNLFTSFWGGSGDLPVNADYDGDGRTDIAVFRPSAGMWFILLSGNNMFLVRNFGLASDKPLPADYDGDGRADIAVFRVSEGAWYILRSSDEKVTSIRFGIASDIPIPADYDGDGRTDLAVYRPFAGTWFVLNSSNNEIRSARFGLGEDKPVAGDFDGDRKADMAVFRASEGMWYLMRSKRGFTAVRFGVASDKVLQADFDGDGLSDIAVFRNGLWFYLSSSDSRLVSFSFGLEGDVPLPGIFVN
ncbi:MAG: FG-GAP-like repeat-containing protein [Pyrinomonadaceae bacterium]|nr:FG-GAP-like repeat-containing protein [Pyrinomonadaceae bacterium]MCX7640959.1 FG-GAP-like repeat-containing protein [Pyrinomonadaceae bacterium]MDW8305118.1 FG-GAP-like repeat-containing protein [Acidobacteriota bacterium]